MSSRAERALWVTFVAVVLVAVAARVCSSPAEADQPALLRAEAWERPVDGGIAVFVRLAGVTRPGIIDLELYDAVSGSQLAQEWAEFPFADCDSPDLCYNPETGELAWGFVFHGVNADRIRVAVGIFSVGWAELREWYHSAAYLDLTPGTPPAVTPTPVPTEEPTPTPTPPSVDAELEESIAAAQEWIAWHESALALAQQHEQFYRDLAAEALRAAESMAGLVSSEQEALDRWQAQLAHLEAMR